MLTQVKINSVTVDSYLVNWENERAYGDVLSEIVLRLKRTVNSAVTLSEGQTVEVWRGWSTATDEKIFSGYIEKIEPEGGLITITAIDKLWDLVRKEATHVYDSTIDVSAGKVSEIFKDLVTTYGGLTADATTVQDSGTTFVLTRFVCNHADIFERCKKLADMLDWQFYYRADTDKVYFEPKGFSTNTNTLTVGTDIISLPKWQYDITEMTNDVTIVGAYQEVETTESGRIGTTSGYTTTGITVAYEPISVKVYGDASNPPTTLKTGGVVNSTNTYDYYIEKAQKKIVPKPSTTFTTNHYYEIRYSLAAPIPVNIYDQYSIDTYGLFKKTITYNDIKNIDDAENRGTNYLVKYATPFIYATLKVKNNATLAISVGQQIRIVDNMSVPTVDEVLVINKHRIKYPANFDEIDVGDKFWRLADFQSMIMEKFKRADEEEFNNTDILNQVVTMDNKKNNPIYLQNRYNEALTQTASGTNVFILGNTNYGVLGTNKLGGAGLGAETLYWRRHYNNTYTETFLDDTFKNASTTATWNTTTHQLTYTSGQTAISESLNYNDGTITTATLTATVSSGTFTYYLSANGGSNWETVTNGALKTFSNTGTDLRWKITESGASTGTITQVVVTK